MFPQLVVNRLSRTLNSVVEALLATKKALVEAVSGPQTVGVEVPMPMVPVETSFGVELTAIASQRCDQHVSVHITFERHVVRRLPRDEDQRRVASPRICDPVIPSEN